MIKAIFYPCFVVMWILLSAVSIATSADRTTRLTVTVVDSFGGSIDPAKATLELREVSSSAEKIVEGFDGVINIPYGLYRLTVAAEPRFHKYQSELVMSGDSYHIRVGLIPKAFGDFEGPRPRTAVRGTLKGAQLDRAGLWGRLVPVYSTISRVRDLQIDEQGRFESMDIAPGAYILMILSGARIVRTREIRIDWYKSYSIEMDLTND